MNCLFVNLLIKFGDCFECLCSNSDKLSPRSGVAKVRDGWRRCDEKTMKGVEFDIEELMRCCDSHYSDLAPFLWRQDKILQFWFKTGCFQRFETYK